VLDDLREDRSPRWPGQGPTGGSGHRSGAAREFGHDTACEMSRKEWGMVGRAPADLQSREFDLLQVKAVMRNYRNKLVDPADRVDEGQS
jgi:hypothetical protein